MGTGFLVQRGGSGSGGILTVTAPAGVTVSVSKDGKVKTKISNAEGLAVFKGLETGTWTLTITDGSQVSTKPVVITADYSTNIAFFMATISITYPEGSICTCSDSVTTLTAPDTSGTWECIVPNIGTWIVSISNGEETAEGAVEITTDGQSESIVLSYILVVFDHGEVAEEVGSFKNVASSSIGNGLISGTDNSTTGTHWYFDKMIDVSRYNTLVVNFVNTGNNTTAIGLRTTIPGSGAVSNQVSQFAAYGDAKGLHSGEFTVDISSLNKGEYYIAYSGFKFSIDYIALSI